MNPIIRRELFELLRTRKAVALQLGLAMSCALLVLVRWPTEEVADLSGTRALQVLRMFAYGLLAGVLLVVPAFPATSLVREKMQGTLALLFNSPLRPWSIYAGKLGGVLGFAALLLVMTLPAAAASFALGGTVVQGGITALYVVLGIAVLQISTLALLVSSYSQSSDGALRVTYALVLVIGVLALAPYALLRGQQGPATEAASWLRHLSPIPAVMAILGHGSVGDQSAGSGMIARYALVSGLACLACALATIARLNHAIFDRTRSAGIMTEDRPREERAARRLLFLIDPQRRSGSISLLVNPVMVKEFRARRFGRSHWALRAIALTAIASLGLSYIAASGALGWGPEIIGSFLVLLQIALLILFAPSLAGGLVSSERESGTWQLLRMTPLSPGVILRGKLLSVAWPLLLLLCATVPGYVVMMSVEPGLVHRIQRVAICLVLTALFSVLTSAASSTVFRSTATAMAVSYTLLLAFCVGPLLLWLGRDAPFGHATVENALRIDPVAAALQASEAPGFDVYELLPQNWWIIGAACLALLVFLVVRTWQLYRPD
jgi:ABC-type transport system involved in multi-copper enzyme maturation permease subunit